MKTVYTTGEAAKICKVIQQTIIPVSYTHLDVYKRQVAVFTTTALTFETERDETLVVIQTAMVEPSRLSTMATLRTVFS